MELLITTALPTLLDHGGRRAHLGRLFTPRMRGNISGTVNSRMTYAADNDCFQGLDYDAWSALIGWLDCDGMSDRLAFVTVPDVVGDSDATLARWHAYKFVAETLPRAFVLQDGSERAGMVPWDEIAGVFVGGSTEWKLGAEARALVAEANARELHVHMGRVNGKARFMYAAEIGVDTIDGSAFGRFPKNKLPDAIEWLHEVNGTEEEIVDVCC